MEVEKVISQLGAKYSGRKIIQNGNPPHEILCEVDPTSEHPGYSMAVAVVDYIEPHYHEEMTETYEVTHGTLTLYLDDGRVVLEEGQSQEIFPDQIHWASGNETWIEVRSKPGWTAKDHILIND